MEEFIAAYYAERQAVSSRTTDAVLLPIVKLIARLNHLHPFIDGNIRTFGVLLLNYLLMSNGFLPAMMWDPNDFDVFDYQGLVKKVREGQEATESYFGRF